MTEHQPLNTKELLDEISSLRHMSFLCVRVQSATTHLRGNRYTSEEMAHFERNFTYPSIEIRGLVVTESGVEISAILQLVGMPRRIKDWLAETRNEHIEHRGKKDFSFSAEEFGWNKEPDAYWGNAYFFRDRLNMTLFCTEYEFPIIQSMISQASRKDSLPAIIQAAVSHPDYLDRYGDLSDGYRIDGWHQGVFCISGWNLSQGER